MSEIFRMILGKKAFFRLHEFIFFAQYHFLMLKNWQFEVSYQYIMYQIDLSIKNFVMIKMMSSF